MIDVHKFSYFKPQRKATFGIPQQLLYAPFLYYFYNCAELNFSTSFSV